jgi:hypothetical protein
VPARPRADFAETEVRRQARGARHGRPVALHRVTGKHFVNEGVEPPLGGRLAHLPGFAKAAAPIGPGGQQAPIVEPLRGRPLRRGRQAGRRRQRRLDAQAPARPIERREHPKGSPGSGLHRVRFDQQRTREAAALDATRANNLAQPALRFGIAGRVTAGEVDGPCPAFLGQPGHDILGAPASQHQGAAKPPKVFFQRPQGVMEPPAAGTAQRSPSRRLVIEDE